jgi:hypothetical protein
LVIVVSGRFQALQPGPLPKIDDDRLRPPAACCATPTAPTAASYTTYRDTAAAIFGGQDATLARIVYVLVAISALWSLSLLGNLKRDTATVAGHPQRT